MTKRLWSNAERNRHFIVPGGNDLRDGNFEIKTVFGESKHISEESILRFEVTREEAKAWIKDELNGVFDEVKASFIGKIATASKSSGETSDHQAQNKGVPPTDDTPGLDLLAALSDSSKQTMREDPVELLGGITQALEDFGAILSKSQTGSDVDLAEAKARMKRLRETFNRHGIDVSDRADSLPDKLSEMSARRADTAVKPDPAHRQFRAPQSPKGKPSR